MTGNPNMNIKRQKKLKLIQTDKKIFLRRENQIRKLKAINTIKK